MSEKKLSNIEILEGETVRGNLHGSNKAVLSRNKAKNDALSILGDIYRRYSLECIQEIAKIQRKTAKELAEAISEDSPRRNSKTSYTHYFEGWTYSRIKEYTDIAYIIHHTRYKASLTNFLEYSHPAGKDRHTVKAFPHIKNNEEKYTEIYIQRIISVLEKG